MSTVNRNMINTGLVLCLDAANPKSIISGNTVWNDLSVNLNNATLLNSPTFNTSNGGAIVFNGSTNIVNIPNISQYAPGTGDFAIEWYQYGAVGGSFPRVFSIGYYAGGCTLALSQEAGTLYYWINSSANGGGTSLGSLGVINNVWSHFVVTRVSGVVRAYKNGSFLGTSSPNTNNATYNSAKYFTIAAESSDGATGLSGSFLTGRIGMFRLYIGKGFSQAEVNQNYNITKGRYGY